MHTPVLLEKVLELLNPQPNQNFIDCTAGAGGHTFAILELAAPKGKVLAIDWDPNAISLLKPQNRLLAREGNYADIAEIARQEKFHPVHGILFDLGFSLNQIEKSQRGFSFMRNEPLDMRYNQNNPDTAEKILNYYSRTQLEHIFKEYGEEQYARQIAAEIIEVRAQKPIRTTKQLVEVIERATPKSYRHKKIHAATKTFQALRIEVNDELGNLQRGLSEAVEILEPGGKIAVLSFHSLEDRIAKNFLKQNQSLNLITKKPVVATAQEIKPNPRARSAKLRVAVKQLHVNSLSQ